MSEEAEIRVQAAGSLGAMLAASAELYGDLTAFENGALRMSYAQMADQGRAFAGYLCHVLGLQPGDRVALMCPNLLSFPVATLGVLLSGAVQVNVNPLYTPTELRHQLADSGATTLVIFAAALPTFEEIRAETEIDTVIVIGPGDPADPVEAAEGALGFDAALAAGRGVADDLPAIGRDDLAFLQYTGGTTGPSKGAMLSHGNVLANIEQTLDRLPEVYVEGEEVVVTALPLYHIFALTANFLSYAAVGARNVLITNPRDMDSFVAAIRDVGLTRINGVNTLFAGLTQHPDFDKIDFSRLKMAIGGGTATLKVTSDCWQKMAGKPILEGYGLSETSPILTVNDWDETEFTGTIGRALKDTDIRILGDDDRDVPDGERGELVCRGPQVFAGYWNRPEATDDAFTAEGYFRTGDIAIREAGGRFRIVDRKKDMVIVSGFNVYPNEVEQVAARCEGVQECACLGVSDERTGEAVKLFVVRQPQSEVTPEAIIAHCRRALAGYKVPRQIEFIDEVPKSAVGKMLRRVLRHR